MSNKSSLIFNLLLFSFISFIVQSQIRSRDDETLSKNTQAQVSSFGKQVRDQRVLQDEQDITFNEASSDQPPPSDNYTSSFTSVDQNKTSTSSTPQSSSSISQKSSQDQQQQSTEDESQTYIDQPSQQTQNEEDEESGQKKGKPSQQGQTKTSETDAKKKIVKKIYAPELVLLTPKMRLGTNTSLVNEGPCGGIEKQPVHYLTRNGSRNYIQWRVYHPSPNATCTVRIGTSDDRLVTLFPKEGSYESDGSFSCAREVGYEGKEFIFPTNYECDDCTFQFSFDYYGLGKINHQCSDLMIGYTLIQECSGKCLNLGDCVNNACVCRAGFSGQFCEVKEQVTQESTNFLYALFILMCLLVFGALIYAIYLLTRPKPEGKKEAPVDMGQGKIIDSNSGMPAQKSTYLRN